MAEPDVLALLNKTASTATTVCSKCGGSGVMPTPGLADCEAILRPNGVEKIACYGQRGHRTHYAVVMEPCLLCAGFDEHVTGCSGIEDPEADLQSIWLAWDSTDAYWVKQTSPDDSRQAHPHGRHD